MQYIKKNYANNYCTSEYRKGRKLAEVVVHSDNDPGRMTEVTEMVSRILSIERIHLEVLPHPKVSEGQCSS